MRGLLASLVLALAACASAPARADDIAYDAVPLQQCIASAGSDAAQLAVCKGAGARPCIASEGDSNMAMTLCWDREASTWGEQVEAIVARLAAAAPTHADALRASQTAWEHWAEAECSYRADLFDGGSGAQLERVTCAADLAVDRVVMLNQTEAGL